MSVDEYKNRWDEFCQNEDRLFDRHALTAKNPDKKKQIASRSIALLRDVGFSQDDITALWNGKASVSLRDHRIQILLYMVAGGEDVQ